MSGDRIRVLRIIARLNVGGPALHAAALCDLNPARYTTIIAYGSLGPSEADMSDLIRGTATAFIPELGRAMRPWHDAMAFIKLLRLMFSYRPHVIHTHTAKAGALGRLAGTLFRLLARRHSCRVVHTFHGHVFEGYFSPAKSRLAVFVERRLAALSDCILTLSDGLRVDLVNRFRIAPAEKIRVVPLGFDLEPFTDLSCRAVMRAELGVSSEACVVACVGRLVPVKNHHLLLQAAGLVQASNVSQPVVFLIVGGGELEAELKRTTEELGLQHAVKFLGWRRDLPAVYAASDIAVLTSHNEGTPVSLIEAMAAGLPVVATRVGGVADVVEDGFTGTLTAPGAPDALARALVSLAGDEGQRAAFGAAGRAHAFERFSRKRLVAQMADLYEELLAGKWRPSHALAN